MKKDALLSWSSGKDSTLALHKVLESGEYNIVSLVTTVTESYERVSMHGLRTELLRQQADSLGIPLRIVLIPKNCTNEIYEERFVECISEYREENIDSIIFGDIFLEDLREYRVKLMSGINIKSIFPIWKMDSALLAKSFIDLGFKAKVVCVDGDVLEKEFSGMEFNHNFIKSLPENVDPCGENGEFHTFTYDGPLFNHCIDITAGEVVLREKRFYYCDFLPA